MGYLLGWPMGVGAFCRCGVCVARDRPVLYLRLVYAEMVYSGRVRLPYGSPTRPR